MPRVELHDVACPAGELALQLGGGTPVLGAHEVGRGHLLPGRRLHRLLEDRQALPRRFPRGLSLDLGTAVLKERLGQGVQPDGERTAVGINVEKRSRLLAAKRGKALPDFRQVAGHQQQMAHRPDARGGLRGDDAAVAVRDRDRRLIARRQHLPDGGDVLDQPRSVGARRLTRLAAARQERRLARHAPLGQQLGSPVPPPRPVLHTCPKHENDSHQDLLVCFDRLSGNSRSHPGGQASDRHQPTGVSAYGRRRVVPAARRTWGGGGSRAAVHSGAGWERAAAPR